VNLTNMESLKVPLIRANAQWPNSYCPFTPYLLFEVLSASDHVTFSESYKALNAGYFVLHLPAAVATDGSEHEWLRIRLFTPRDCLFKPSTSCRRLSVFIIISSRPRALPSDVSYRKPSCSKLILIKMSHKCAGMLFTSSNSHRLID